MLIFLIIIVKIFFAKFWTGEKILPQIFVPDNQPMIFCAMMIGDDRCGLVVDLFAIWKWEHVTATIAISAMENVGSAILPIICENTSPSGITTTPEKLKNKRSLQKILAPIRNLWSPNKTHLTKDFSIFTD